MILHIRFCCILILPVLLGSCSVGKIQESRYSGECKELLVLHYLSKPDLANVYSNEYMLVPQKHPKTSTNLMNVVGKLDAGHKIIVSDLIKKPDYIYWSDYLRVTVRIVGGEFDGVIADVPTCTPFHPAEKWITECTLDPGVLQFDPMVVRGCDI